MFTALFCKVKNLLLFLFVLLLLIGLRTLLDISPQRQHHEASHVPREEVNEDDYNFIKLNTEAVLSSSTAEANCSTVLEDPHYRMLVDSYLNAWYRFVPHQSKMDASNCWYVKNFSTPPKNLLRRLTRLVNFDHFQAHFSLESADMILSTIFEGSDSFELSSQPTDHYFCLPNINLIGFTKTGSTLLYNYFELHPLLAKPHSKEGQFWRDVMDVKTHKHQELAVLFYLFHFYAASRKIRENPSMFTIDATVSTAFATSRPLKEPERDACVVPFIISKTMPKMKLLVQTRNPVDRLWSDFFFFCTPQRWKFGKLRKLEQTASNAASLFHNFTIAALREFRACIEGGHTQLHCTTLAGSYPATEASCKRVRLGISMYYIHLIKWFRIFQPEQLYVIKLKDLTSEPVGTMVKVWDFLGMPLVEESPTIGEKVRSSTSKWEIEGFGMLPKTREILRQFFHPYNLKLARLLGDEHFLWTE